MLSRPFYLSEIKTIHDLVDRYSYDILEPECKMLNTITNTKGGIRLQLSYALLRGDDPIEILYLYRDKNTGQQSINTMRFDTKGNLIND